MDGAGRRRVAVACIALGAYAACGDGDATELQHMAHGDVPKMDYAQPETIEDAGDYVIPAPRPKPRVSRRSIRRPPTAPTTSETCTLDDIKRMESGGRYDAVSSTGKYRGAHQFDARTWRGAVTRAGHPEWADTPVDQVPPAVQDAAAAQLYAERGTQPWSVC